MKNYFEKLSHDKNINIKAFKNLLTSVAHKGVQGETFKGDLKIKGYDKVLIVLYQTLPTQKPLSVNKEGVQVEEREGRTYIHIPTKNLKDGEHILVQDRDGGVLIDYTIVVE